MHKIMPVPLATSQKTVPSVSSACPVKLMESQHWHFTGACPVKLKKSERSAFHWGAKKASLISVRAEAFFESSVPIRKKTYPFPFFVSSRFNDPKKL